MKTYLAELGRSRPDAQRADPASFVDLSIVKSLEDEGFIGRVRRPS